MSNQKSVTIWIDGLLSVGLFGLALWLRTTSLTHFVTADEHNWVYRSGLFLAALLEQDWPSTETWLTPGVTTTWLGAISLNFYYQTHAELISRSLPEWLGGLPRNKIDLNVLWYLRWSIALCSATMVALIYGLARQLWPRPLVLLGTLLLLSEPHLLAVSRIIGHDALVTFFMVAALLTFLIARMQAAPASTLLEAKSRPRPRWSSTLRPLVEFCLSGIFAGLAVLSKAVALFLLPFVGLIALVDWWQHRNRFAFWGRALLIWGGSLWLTFVAVWPAAWVDPLGQTWAVIGNAFLSSVGLEDPDIQPYWAVPNLGIWYYWVNGAYKVSPILTLGGILAIIGIWFSRNRLAKVIADVLNNNLAWLAIFALGFTLMMTLGVKQSPRYILPTFPALVFIAAWGWLAVVPRIHPHITVLGLGVLAIGLTLQYAPYYYTYLNPLLGGALTGPQTVRIGWGEGLDEVGRWLNNKPDAYADRLGVRYTATIYPFYAGSISSPISEELDYVTFYIKQSQSGYPAPEILAYFAAQGALHQVVLDGVTYAQIYQGPGMTPITGEDRGQGQTELPIAFRPMTIYAPIGDMLTVDLLWSAKTWPSTNDETISLTFSKSDGSSNFIAEAPIVELPTGAMVSHHQVKLPPDLARDTYLLKIADVEIGHLKARRLRLPDNFEPLSFVLNRQVKLVGIQSEQKDDHLLIDLAWQGWPRATNDYTAFVQLLNAQGERVTGVDVAPEWGFTRLSRKEIEIAPYDLPLPAEIRPGSYQVLIGLYYFAGAELINAGRITLDQPIKIE